MIWCPSCGSLPDRSRRDGTRVRVCPCGYALVVWAELLLVRLGPSGPSREPHIVFYRDLVSWRPNGDMDREEVAVPPQEVDATLHVVMYHHDRLVCRSVLES
jgi:hypothetical protein